MPVTAGAVTPDGRYLVVRGRLWRRSDPRLSAAQRANAVAALMRARRAVRDAADEQAVRRARARVERAKRALGERGPVWWTDGTPDYNRCLVKNMSDATGFASPPDTPGARTIDAAILRLLGERASTASACPSEIARRLRPGGSGWRALMAPVRAAVARLCRRGKVRATRGGRELTGADLEGGPIRIRRGPMF